MCLKEGNEVERIIEKSLQKIVELYFYGYTVSEAIQEIDKPITKKEPLSEGPDKTIQK